MSEETALLEALRVRLSVRLEALRGRWAWIVGVGAGLAGLGGVALGSLAAAGVAGMIALGLALIAAGVLEILHGLGQMRSGRAAFWWGLGLLYLLCGGLVLRNPAFAAGALTLLLGAGLAASGVLRITLALQVRPLTDAWGWVAASGAATVMLGLVLLLLWPASSLAAIGLLLAFDLMAAGLGWVLVGLALRRQAAPAATD